MSRLQLAHELIRFGELVRLYEAAGWPIPESLSSAYHAAGLAWDRDAEAVQHRAQPPVQIPAPRKSLVRSSR